jgi:hypothetical protein
MSGELVVLSILILGMLVATAVVIQTRRRRRDETPTDRLRRDKLDLERGRAWLRRNRATSTGATGAGIWAARGAGIWASGRSASLGIWAAGVANGGDAGDAGDGGDGCGEGDGCGGGDGGDGCGDGDGCGGGGD